MKHEWLGRIFSTVLLIAAPTTLSAQDVPDPPARHMLSVAAGAMEFDLSGTGITWVTTARVTRALTNHLAIEVGASFSRPEQDIGVTSFIAPEAHLQYYWKAGRVRPYAGGGVGFAHTRARLIGNDTDFTMSVAGGARIDLTPKVALFGEMRLRGNETDFVGTTAEWVGGFSWLLGN